MREIRIVNHTSAVVQVSVEGGVIRVVVGRPDGDVGDDPDGVPGGPVLGRYGAQAQKVIR